MARRKRAPTAHGQRSLYLDQAPLQGDQRQLGLVADAELLHRPVQVALDRPDEDDETVGDLRVAHSVTLAA